VASRARVGRAALIVAALWPVACDRLATNLGGGFGAEAGILRAKLPVEERGVSHVKRLTDGIAAATGDPSRTDLTAVLAGPEAFVTWDLGGEVPVRCALVDADGDDRYTLSLSSDGRTFTPLWTAEPDEEGGQQLRAGRDLKGVGRYLRVTAAGGDGRFSVAEVSAWRDCPSTWPPLAMQKGEPDEQAVRFKLWAFGPAAFLFLLFYRRRWPDWVKLLGVVPAGLAIALGIQLAQDWPPSSDLTFRVGAVLFFVLVAAVLRFVAERRTRASARDEAPPTS
jgi:hypothetical protein